MINFTAIKDNFWKTHPDMSIVEPFKSLFNNDKTTNKDKSSKMMWFVVLCYDRTSKYYRLAGEGEDGKHILIGEDFLGNKEYYHEYKEQLDSLIDKYLALQMTATQRLLHDNEEILDTRRKVMKELSQSKLAKDWANLDKMMKGTKSITDEIEKIKAKIDEEDSTGLTKGGGALSLRD